MRPFESRQNCEGQRCQACCISSYLEPSGKKKSETPKLFSRWNLSAPPARRKWQRASLSLQKLQKNRGPGTFPHPSLPAPRVGKSLSGITFIKPFPLQDKWRSIRPLSDVQPGEQTCALEVTGLALSDSHIIQGDHLVFVFGREPRPGDLCVVQTPTGLTARFFYPSGSRHLLLKSAHSTDIWLASEIKVLGVVRRVERDL